MVSNSSSFGQDLSEIGEALGLIGEDPVLPGDPATLGETAQHLSTLGQSAEKAARGFAAIDTQRWSGQAADGFRGFLETSPPRWRTAADAFEKAGTAVGRYVQALADAQRQAAQAQRQLDDAEQRSQQARQAHNAQVDAANAGGTQPGTPPAAFVDPAAEQRAAAQHQLDRAREAVQVAGQEAARAVTAAANTAPGKPGFFAQAGQELTDAFQEEGRTVASMASGLGEAVGGVVQLARTLNPVDPWNLTHPQQAVQNASTLAAGMVGVVKNPWQGAKTVADVDGWKSDPARAVGSCIPDAVASLAGGAGVASRAATGARHVSEAAADTSRAARAAEHVEDGAFRADPHPHLPGEAPGQEFEQAERVVQQQGNPVGSRPERWDELTAHDRLPAGVSERAGHPYSDGREGFLYNAGPRQLFRKLSGSVNLDEVFSHGNHARAPERPADVQHLGAHLGGTTSNSPFVSTTDSLGHAISRDGGSFRGFHEGAILDIRAPSGHAVDMDATMHRNVPNHWEYGEAEHVYLRHLPPEHIRGAWKAVDGHVRYFKNPNFVDHGGSP